MSRVEVYRREGGREGVRERENNEYGLTCHCMHSV